jgi:predicted HNH restriction endonuclease
MGQAKKELERREHNEAIKRKILKDKGYSFCEICDQEFTSKHGSLLCDECWEHKTRD